VSKLIDNHTKWWNIPLFKTLFTAEEVRMIETIPVSRTNQEDVLMWRGTPKGVFSVKSAYHLHMEALSIPLAGSSACREGTNIWKGIWSLPVPSVEKNFLWRACKDILPTRENLWKGKIITDPSCPLCDSAVESGFHILWQCPAAMDVWSLGNTKLQKSCFIGPDFIQVVQGVFKKCNQDELVQFVGLARRIWLRRNEVVHGGVFSHPRTILQQTTNSIQEYAMAQGKGDTPAPLVGNNFVNCGGLQRRIGVKGIGTLHLRGSLAVWG
jgi:hypothetical protein